MFEAFEYVGQWWPSGFRDHEVPGTLRFSSADGATLGLIGAFEDDPNRVLAGEYRDVIHGLTSNGDMVTLYRCHWISGTVASQGFPVSTYTADLVFLNAHLEDIVNTRFSGYRAAYDGLSYWADRPVFSHVGGDGGDRQSISFDRPKLARAELVLASGGQSHVRVLVDSKFKVTASAWPQRTSMINEPYMELEVEPPMLFNELLELASTAVTFVAMGVGRSLSPRWTELVPVAPQREDAEPDVEIYYSPAGPETERDVSPAGVLFRLRDVEDTFSRLLPGWIDLAYRAPGAMRLYRAFISQTYGDVTQRFLLMASALESYHRDTIGGWDLPKLAHESRMDAVLREAPSEYAEWLKVKLRYSNEPSLRRRLRELVGKTGSFGERLGFTASFIQAMVETRNYYVHGGDSPGRSVLDGVEMYRAAERMRVLLEVVFMIDCGFGKEKVKDFFLRGSRVTSLERLGGGRLAASTGLGS